MNVSTLRFPIDLFLSRFCLPRNASVRFVALALLAALATAPSVHAQTAHFSGAQITIPTSSLFFPYGLAVDVSGDVFINDSSSGKVLKETPSNGSYIESLVVSGGLSSPDGIAVDSNGNLYIADSGNSRVVKETLLNGTYSQSTIGSGLNYPRGVAVDGSGNVYIADSSNNRILVETPSAGSYIQTTLPTSSLNGPSGVAVDGSGNVYIADLFNGRVLKETSAAGGSYVETTLGSALLTPISVAVDGSGNVYISDPNNQQVFKETPSSGSYVQSTVSTNGVGYPEQIAVDQGGNLYLDDTFNNRVLEEKSSANFGTLNIGSPSLPTSLIFTFDTAGNIAAPSVRTQGAIGLDFTDAGTGSCTTNGISYAYNAGDTCTVNVTFTPKTPGSRYGAAVLQTAAGSTIATGYVQGTGLGPQINFLPATTGTVGLSNTSNPYAIATDASGNLYVAEAGNVGTPNAVVKETWTGSGYTESTVASGLAYPVGVAVDGAGNVYIADQDATEVLKESPTNGGGYTQTAAFSNLGNVEGVAVDGSGNVYIGSLAYHLLKETLTGGSYLQSTVDSTVYPYGIAVDGSGNIYFSQNGSQLFKETLSGGSYVQSTIANGLGRAYGVTLDGSGNLYVADIGNSGLYKETPTGSTYIQSAVAGALNGVLGVAVDGKGNVFASSDEAGSVWKVDFSDAPSLSFAATAVGSTSTNSFQTVTVENAGNTALTFPIPATGNNPSIVSNFTLINSGTSTCSLLSASSSAPATLAPGASCTLPIGFAPTVAGALSGSLVLADNNLNITTPAYATQTISLSGTATPGTPTITWPTPAAITYGTLLSTQLNATSTIAGTFAYTPTFNTLLNAGTQTLSVTFTPADTNDYTTATATTTIVVSPAAPRLLFTPISGQIDGSAPFAVSATSASAGLVSYAVVSGPATISGNMVTLTGTGTIALSASQAATANYTAATANTSFVVGAPFVLASSSASGASGATATVAPGAAATFGLMLTPAAGTTFPDAVTFTATGLPTGATATFSPSSIAAGSTATSVTLTIQTINSQTARNQEPLPGAPVAPIALGFLLLPLVGVKSLRNRLSQMRRLPMLLLAAALSLGAVLGMSGCAGGGNSTPSTAASQSYTVVVTAKDSSNEALSSTNLTITVQ